MAELAKLLQCGDACKLELMEAFLCSLEANLSISSTTTTIFDTSASPQQISDNRNTNTATTTTNASSLGSGSDHQDKAVTNVDEATGSEKHFYVNPSANCLSDVQQTLLEIKKRPEDKRRLLINQITDVTIEAHMATTLNTQENIREANERIARQQEAMGSQMPDISKLTITPAMMMQHFTNSMVPEMTKVVNFSKNLPGFSALDMDDQVTLVKQGIFEVMIARITLLIDHVTDTMIDPSLKVKSPRSMVQQMSPLGHFIGQFFSIAKQINILNLTDGEHGLFGAILFLCPDRHGLKNVTVLRNIQQLYLQALHQLMRYNHKDADGLFCSLISSIKSIRKLNDEHFRICNNMYQKTESFPQLHREMFDTRDL